MRAHCRPHTPATRVLRDFVDPENARYFIFPPTLKFYFEKYETERYKNNCLS